jgi:hypothetical protein
VHVTLTPIPGFEAYYGITRQGDVFSFPRVDARGHQRNGKWLKHIPDGDGYPRVHLCVDGVRRKWQIHRLVAITFIPNPDGKPEVNHKDGNKKNNDFKNLEWATTQENFIHALRHGLVVNLRDQHTGRFLKHERHQHS